MLVLTILSILLLVLISYQDFKTFSISWWLIPLIFITGIAVSYLSIGLGRTFKTLLINAGFISFLILSIALLVAFKHGKFINITESYLGWGDILFLISIIGFFSSLNFMFFIITGLILTLLAHQGYKYLGQPKHPRIPLAGYIALVLIVVIIIKYFSKGLNLYDDYWLYKRLS